MRTLIQGGWVVGFDGRSHQLLRDGAVVFEDDLVIHVGQTFDEPLAQQVVCVSWRSAWSHCVIANPDV